MPLISINIPCYNQAKNLPFIFHGYNAQRFYDFEVLICDDGSSDNTEEVVKKYQKEMPYSIRYFRHEHKGNRLAEAQNMGLKNAKGKFLLNTNGDIIPMPHFKMRLGRVEFPFFSMLENYINHLDEKTVLSGVRHGLKDDFIQRDRDALNNFELIRENIINFDFRSQILPEIKRVAHPYYLVSGNNFLAPIKAIKAVGGWDGDIIDYGWDDYILNCKLFNLGLKFVGLPHAIGLHIEHPRSKVKRDINKSQGFKRLKYYEKKYGLFP